MSGGGQFLSCLGGEGHDSNLKKLEEESRKRRRFLNDLSLCREELKAEEANLDEKRRFLSDLPGRLAEVEKATLPLKDGFPRKLSASAERKRIADLAVDLPGPLYVLASQVQAFLDAYDERELRLEIVPPAVRVHCCEVSVEFCHLPRRDVVTVRASGEGIDEAFLLPNLFQEDFGEDSPNSANHHADHENDFTKARPYLWAQYLAGLHFLPNPKKTNVAQNCSSILKALKTRITSHRTLFRLSETLRSKPSQIPTHPSLPQDVFPVIKAPNTRLVFWDRVSNDKSLLGSDSPLSTHIYHVKLMRTFPVFEFYVKITSEYPRVPPRWFLPGGEEKTRTSLVGETSHLYDTNDALVASANTSFLEHRGELSDYILCHQLKFIMTYWEVNANPKSSDAIDREIVRMGRDRALRPRQH